MRRPPSVLGSQSATSTAGTGDVVEQTFSEFGKEVIKRSKRSRRLPGLEPHRDHDEAILQMHDDAQRMLNARFGYRY